MLLRPSAFARFNFSKYNIVISSSSAEAKHIRTNKKTKHMKTIFKLLIIAILFSSCQEQKKIGFINNGDVIDNYQIKVD